MYKFECFDNDDIQYDEVSIPANYDAVIRVHFGKDTGNMTIPAAHNEIGVACFDMITVNKFLMSNHSEHCYVRTVIHCKDMDCFVLTLQYGS